jgi:hypothetical protein
MSISFSRSMRSLQRDSFRLSVVALIIAILLLLAWTAWFFLAKVPLYEISRQFEVQRDGSLAVTFSPQALARIRPGQSAALRLAETAEDQGTQTLSALVMDTPTAGSRTNQVKLYVFSPEPLQPGLAGEVRIEVEYVSPARLVMRSAGRYMGR